MYLPTYHDLNSFSSIDGNQLHIQAKFQPQLQSLHLPTYLSIYLQDDSTYGQNNCLQLVLKRGSVTKFGEISPVC